MIHLYTDSSPNGFKITIMLEEISLLYELHHVQIDKGENQLPQFLLLNPYGRIPVIYDDETDLTIFESGAILQYLAMCRRLFVLTSVDRQLKLCYTSHLFVLFLPI